MWLSFLSDLGHEDTFLGVCKGVIARTAPDVRVLDVLHLVPPQDVEHGAALLASAVPYLPAPAVHLALVDPFRPAPVRPVAVRTADGSTFVAPDNGLTSTAWDAAGGAVAAYALENRDLWLATPARTFRGRDVFSPVAARLADGLPVEQVGPPVPVESLERLRLRTAVVEDDHVHGEIAQVDHFGNLTLNCTRGDLEAAGIVLGDDVELRCVGRAHVVPFAGTYGEVPTGRLVLCEDAFRTLTLAVNRGSAAVALRAGRGEPLVLARRRVPAQSEDAVPRPSVGV